jgi:Flp pilus assembly protein TadD
MLSFMGSVLGEDKKTRGQAEMLLREAQRRRPNDFWINEDLCWFFAVIQRSHPEEAVRFAAAAVALRPQSPGAHLNLGNALADSTGRLDEAIAEYREAIRLNQNWAEPHENLGHALRLKGQLDEAIAEYRETIRLKKSFAGSHNGLGNALHDKGRWDEAIAEYREAIRIDSKMADPHNGLANSLRAKGQLDAAIAEFHEAIRLRKDFADAHKNLGVALQDKGQVDEAIAEYREAIRIKKDDPQAHYNLANALYEKGRLEEALFEYREAIQLKKGFCEAHCNLGRTLATIGRLDEAIPEFREAIRFQKDNPVAHHNLGSALATKGHLDDAIEEFREAIRLKKDYAQAHCHLGLALMQKGRYRQAVNELRRGDELGSHDPRWALPSEQWLRNAERLADLDSRLPALLEGEGQPKDAGERLLLARLCQLPHKKLYFASARWYAEAFAAQSAMGDNLGSGNRYNAACAAALAGCGQGQDAADLDESRRAHLRRQALDWLRADLGAWRNLLAKDLNKFRPVLTKKLQQWEDESALAGVRGMKALQTLPESERTNWQRLWREIKALRERAAQDVGPN